MAELLEVKNLSVSFFTPAGEVQAVRDVSFSLRAGEVLAIVGESGCGKSVLCKSILHLLPPSARRKSGTIAVNGRDITRLRERELQKLRGSLFSMVFQDPMTALNPSMTVGAQLAAAVRVHAPRLRGAALEQRVLELMRLVGIDRPEERRGLYPHHFSGGMRQRVVLAIALAGDPSILFADEPTTALDVTIQAQILDLLREIQQKLGTATVYVTPFRSSTSPMTSASWQRWRTMSMSCTQARSWRQAPSTRSSTTRATPTPGVCCSRSRRCPVESRGCIPFPACRPR